MRYPTRPNHRTIFWCVCTCLLLNGSVAMAQQAPEPREEIAPDGPAPEAQEQAEEGGDGAPISFEAQEEEENDASPSPVDIEARARRAQQELEDERKARIVESMRDALAPEPIEADTDDEALHTYYLGRTEDAPRLEPDQPSICFMEVDDDSRVWKAQCDEHTKVCKVALLVTWREVHDEDSGASSIEPATLDEQFRCVGVQRTAQEFEMFVEESGYRVVMARPDAPYGYERDEFEQLFQTHFDLRSRFLIGVYYAGIGGPAGWSNTLGAEVGAHYEHFNEEAMRRHRYRFLQATLGGLDPTRLRGTLFEYDYSRAANDPLLWLTTLVGEPKRYDLFLNLGTGITLGRLDYWRFEDRDDVMMLDVMEGRLHWEALQGGGLEDYLMIYAGTGIGVLPLGEQDTSPYLYPELGARAAATLGERGLVQLALDARAKQAFELDSDGRSWRRAMATASAEWVTLAINDQPLSLYLQPEYHYLDRRGAPRGGERAFDPVHEYRVMSGMRLSLFVPPPSRAVRRLEGYKKARERGATRRAEQRMLAQADQ